MEFHDQMTGHAIVTNRSRCDHTYTLIVWDHRSTTDQRSVAHHSVFVPAGGTAWLSVGFAEECGRTYQRDVYMDLPPLPPGFHYTLSDVANAVFWAPGVLTTACGGGGGGQMPPPRPPADLPPSFPPVGYSTSCELGAFAQIDEMQVNGGVASIRLRLRDGYDHVTVFMMAYSSATPFPIVSGRASPTFPQSLVEHRSFVLRAGAAQTISIAVPGGVAAYQIDAGCVAGPAVLHSRQTYPAWAFLEAAVGNN